MKRIALLSLLLLLGFAIFLQCAPEQDAGDIARALADRLTDALDFENGHPEDGPPPEDHAGDPAYPQIISMDAPSALGLGELFTIRLTTDFADTARIAGALVHVDLAAGHIVVDAPYDEALGFVQIQGRLREDPRIQGRPFLVFVGLRDIDGAVGNYVEWRLNVTDDLEADAAADAEAEAPQSQPGAPCNATDSPCEGAAAPDCIDIDGTGSELICSHGCGMRADCTLDFPGGCCLELPDQSVMCAPASKCGRGYLEVCTTPFSGICNDGLLCINETDGTGHCWYACDVADRTCADNGVCINDPPTPPVCFPPGSIAYDQICGDGFGYCGLDLWCLTGGQPTGVCRHVCSFPGGACADGGTCVQIESEVGYCQPP